MIRNTLILLMIGLLHSTGAAQQAGIAVGGQVIGSDSEPLPGQPVVLHRVDETGGATIAEALTDADGRFSMTAGSSADTSAVYFVAARHEGELYIGAPFKPGMPGITDQQIQVGVPGMSASAMLSQQPPGAPVLPAGRPATSRTWLLMLIPLVGVAAVAVFMLVPRGRIPEQRTLLIRVAEIDERTAAATGAEQETLKAERAAIMTRLRSG